MVVWEYNRPAQYNRIALFRLKIKAFDVRTTKMKKFFYTGITWVICVIG